MRHTPMILEWASKKANNILKQVPHTDYSMDPNIYRTHKGVAKKVVNADFICFLKKYNLQVFPISWQKLCRKELHASPHDLNFSSLVIFQINYIESYLHDMIGLTNPSHMLGVIPHLFERRYSTSIYCRFPSQALQYWREIKSSLGELPENQPQFPGISCNEDQFYPALGTKIPIVAFWGWVFWYAFLGRGEVWPL